MSQPTPHLTSATKFLSDLERSNLLPAEQLAAVKSNSSADSNPVLRARGLVDQGLLTPWQAEQLLAGRFSFFLGKYRLLERIGSGGMGSVYKALQLGLERVVAIKLMDRQWLKKPGALDRFRREIQATAALSHPNIVRAYDADHVGNAHFLVLEYVEGADLHSWLSRLGRLPIPAACECIRQALLGLQHAHEHGLVHRDLKPANLLMTRGEDGRALIKILDLGLARVISETGEAEITKTGEILGTVSYLAPEQILDFKRVDIRADIFSLGCTFFELLTGERPFTLKSYSSTFLTDLVPPSARSRRPEVPPAVESVLQRMLAPDPDHRYQTPAEAAQALAPLAAPFHPDLETPGTGETQVAGDSGCLHDSGSLPSTTAPAVILQATLDPELDEFLQVIGDSEARAQPGTTARRRLRRHRRQGRRAVAAVLGSMAVLALFGLGHHFWQRAGQAVVSVEWPAAIRAGGAIDLDGRIVPIPPDGPIEITSTGGAHRIQLARPGHEPLFLDLNLARGDRRTIEPQWRPLPQTLSASRLAELEQRAENARTREPDDPVVERLRTDILDVAADAITTPQQIVHARSLLGRLPSSLDRLPILAGPATAPADLVATLGTVGDGHWDRITSMAISPDGQILVSASMDQTVRLWRLATGEPIGQFVHRQGIEALAISPDGKRIAYGARELHICEFPTGRELRTIELEERMRALAFSPISSLLAVATGGVVHLWEPEGETASVTLQGHTGDVRCLAFDPKGRWLAAGDDEGKVWIWNLETAKVLRMLGGEEDGIRAARFSPDGRLLATAGGDRTVRIWEIETGKEVRRLEGSRGSVATLTWDHRGERLASGGSDQTISVWEPDTGRRVGSLERDGTIEHLAFTADGTGLAYAERNQRIGFWELGRDTTRWTAGGSPVRGVAFGADGVSIASGEDSSVRLWDIAGGVERSVLAPAGGKVGGLAMAPAGTTLAAAGLEGSITLFDVRSGAVLRTLSGPPPAGRRASGLAEGIALAPSFDLSGQRLVATAGDRSAIIWDVASGKPLAHLSGHEGPVTALAFRPDSLTVATGSEDRTVRLWDAATGGEWRRLDVGGAVTALAFATSGEELAVGTAGSIVIHEVRTDKLRTITDRYSQFRSSSPTKDRSGGGKYSDSFGSRLSVSSLAWVPDASLLASAHRDGQVRFWSTQASLLEGSVVLGPPGGRIHQVSFSPSGRYLATANDNGTISVLRMRPRRAAGGK